MREVVSEFEKKISKRGLISKAAIEVQANQWDEEV